MLFAIGLNVLFIDDLSGVVLAMSHLMVRSMILTTLSLTSKPGLRWSGSHSAGLSNDHLYTSLSRVHFAVRIRIHRSDSQAASYSAIGKFQAPLRR